MDVVKLLESGEGFVRWVVVVRRRGETTYVNSPTREAALYEARGAARDWGVLRMRLAGVASEDVLGWPRFLAVSVLLDLGPDDGCLGCEEDVAGVGEAERDEVGEADSGEKTSTLPFLAAESDSISSVSESSIASLGGDCGRVGGALGAVGALMVAVDAIGALLDSLALGAVCAFLVAVDASGAVLDGALGAVDAFPVPVDVIVAVLHGLGLALDGNFVAESPPPKPGPGSSDPGDDTASPTSGLFIEIVASFFLGSLDDPYEAGPSVKDLRVEEGGAADAVLTGDFPGPIGDDIWWLLSL